MFRSYEIKKEQKEEVLYLYLDLNTEFAKTRNEKKTSLKQEVDHYINKNKINFKGSKIVLMVGSLMVGSMLYTAPLLKKEENNLNYNYSVEVLNNEEEIASNIEETKIETPIKEEQKETEIKKEQKTENKTNQTIEKKPITSNIVKKPITPAVKEEETKTTPVETVENKTTVTIYRRNGSILNIELEEYLIGVVAAEMPASFHSEALKAQAVAARTYALKAIENHTRLTDTVSTQVYKDNNELKASWGSAFNTYYNKVKDAVNATKGEVMTYNGSLINAYYHSTSNGYTEDASAVFGSYPYLKSVESPLDQNVSSFLRTVTLTYEEISNKLGVPITSLSSIEIEKNNSNHVNKIIIDNNIYGGVEFRTKLGLRSTDFELTLNENNITITTKGYGHGVGMSQYGANEYAKTGMSYTNILKHYYTGITIKKV